MPVIEISDLSDPRLVDYAHLTDVALKKARGTEHGLYIAESALVLQRALRAGHRPRSVLALGNTVDEARALVGEDVPVFVGPGELLAELTGYILHRGVIAAMHRPELAAPDALLDWPSTRALLDRHGFHVAALALAEDAVSLRDFRGAEHERLALLLGAEGEGLTGDALAASDSIVQIPMKHGIDSLNVAAASAVAMWALSG